ncbi:MAG: YkuS family protein [Bacillota bacterium]
MEVMKLKHHVVGVQKELNEIAQELIRQGIEVTEMLDTEKRLDAIVYHSEESNITRDQFQNTSGIVKINAAKNNIDQIVRKIKSI